MECDFCSSPLVVKSYQFLNFASESEDAGILYPDKRNPFHTVNIVLESIGHWAACSRCAKCVDDEDIEGLLRSAQFGLTPRYGWFSDNLKAHLRRTYELFFTNRIRIKEG